MLKIQTCSATAVNSTEGMATVKEETLSPVESCFDFSSSNNCDDVESTRKYSCSSNDSTSTNCSDFSSFDVFLQTKDQLRRSYFQNTLSNGVDMKFSDSQTSKIQMILDSVKSLSEPEKVLFYTKLPLSGYQPSASLSTSKWEQTQAFQWIRNNLEECDGTVNLPKHEVYDDYKSHCENQGTKRFLSAPDFGKIVKCMFPNVKARRLGTRGNSKYCYNGLTRKDTSAVLEPVPGKKSERCNALNKATAPIEEDSVDQVFTAACKVVCEWANKLLGRCFNTLIELTKFLVNGSYVSTKSMAAFIVMSTTDVSIEEMNQRYNIKNLSNSKPQSTKQVTATSNSRNRVSSLPNGICTPSKTVRGVKNTKSLNNSPCYTSTVVTTSSPQVVPAKPPQFENSRVKNPNSNNNSNKMGDVNFNQFSIDVNAPIFLDDHSLLTEKSNRVNEYVLNGVNVVVKDEPIDSVFVGNPPVLHPGYHPTTPPLTPKREEKRKIELHQSTTTVTASPTIMLHATTVQQYPSNLQSTTTATTQPPPPKSPSINKTPRKVGRPRNSTKKSQPGSPYSPRSAKKYTIASPKSQPPHMPPMMPPPSPVQGFHNRFQNNWQVHISSQQHVKDQQQQQQQKMFQQQQIAMRPGMPTAGCDVELQNIFMNFPQTPPGHGIVNDNNRCQSVPVPILQHNGIAARNNFQPLTPQMNTSNNRFRPPSENTTFYAKRNLNSLFDESTTKLAPQPILPRNQMVQNSSMIYNPSLATQDRIVPTSNVTAIQNRSVPHHHQQQQQLSQPQYSRNVGDADELYDLGFTLNDLSTPEEMGDIPSGLENIDGDDLIKSLQNPNNNWASDWSTSTVPLMNIS